MSDSTLILRQPLCRFVVIAVCLACGHGAIAQDMDKQTENHIKQATVQVWIGEAVQGQESRNWLGVGSGSFVNRTGLVVTNNHVVDPGHRKTPAQKLELRIRHSVLKYRVIVNGGTESEKEYEGYVQYQNESADLALVQTVDEDDEPLATSNYLELLPSDNLQEGDPLWCFGFPGGDKMSTRKDKHAEVTISKGNIVELPRTPGGRIPQIGTDVKASKGNSGGPLVNPEGKVIGVLSQGGVSSDTGDGIVVRIIPADLVADVIKVAVFRGKIRSDSDFQPFLSLLSDQQGHYFLPGLERSRAKSVMRLFNGDEIHGQVTDEQLLWKTPLGEIQVSTKLAAYALSEDGQTYLLLDGGDRLSSFAGDTRINFLTSHDRQIQESMSKVAKLAFRKPDHGLTPPDVDAVMIDGEGCRILLTDLDGEVKFETETGVADFPLADIKRVETHKYKRVLTTVQGTTLTGKFVPHDIQAKLAWTGTPVKISLARVRSATIRQRNPAKAGRPRWTLAQRLSLDQPALVDIADGLEKGDLTRCRTLINDRLERSALKSLPRPVRERVKLLDAECLLREGQYEQARAKFKKGSKRAALETVKWYAAARYELLDHYADGTYQGKPLSDPRVFEQAADQLAEQLVASARVTIKAYENAPPDKHNSWKNLVRKLQEHEEELRIADSLEPGCAENDVFRVWRFSQDLTDYEYRRIFEAIQEVQRQMGDGGGKSRTVSQKQIVMNRKLERLFDERKRVDYFSEDVREKMNEAGFRLDDPAAAEILN